MTINLSQRTPFLYIERARISKKDHGLLIGRSEGDIEVPIGLYGGILCGPGTSITHEAMILTGKQMTVVCFTGGGGLPLWSYVTKYRSPINKIKQYNNCYVNQKTRIKIANRLLTERNKVLESLNLGLPVLKRGNMRSIEEILGVEGAWVKEMYKTMRLKYPGINHSQWKQNLQLLNHFVYGVSGIVIAHLGLDPNIGIIHGQTRGGGLVFDLADIWKPVLALCPSYYQTFHNKSANEIKANICSDIEKLKVVDRLIDLTKECILDID